MPRRVVRTLGPLGSVILGTAILFCAPSADASHPPQNMAVQELTLQLIVVRSPEEAQEVIERLNKGEDFSKLAKEKSIDPTAEVGGFMGQFAPGTLRAELRDALKGVGAGQFTPVVHIPSGYAILKIMGGNAVAASKVADPARSFAMAATGTVKYVNDVDGLG